MEIIITILKGLFLLIVPAFIIYAIIYSAATLIDFMNEDETVDDKSLIFSSIVGITVFLLLAYFVGSTL